MMCSRCPARLIDGLVQPVQQRCNTVRVDGNGFDDGYAQFGAQTIQIDDLSAFSCQICHVQRKYHRMAQRDDIQNEFHAAPKVGGISDENDEVNRCFAGFVEQGLPCDSFILCERGQAVYTGQIGYMHSLSGWQEKVPFLFFDSDAGIIGDFLVCAGQTVEKCGFSAVRVADQGDGMNGRICWRDTGFAFRRIHDRFGRRKCWRLPDDEVRKWNFLSGWPWDRVPEKPRRGHKCVRQARNQVPATVIS